MERNIKVNGITLKKIALGESNIGVSLLTEGDEVIFVLAFGAAKSKSKFFSSVKPFVSSSWDLYFDPVKEYWRAKDATVITYNDALQEKLESFYTASLLSEIILKSQGSEGSYSLFLPALKLLQEPINHRVVLIQFILRLLTTQGLLPSFEYCPNCEREIEKEPLYYTGLDEFICGKCLRGPKTFELNQGIITYCIKTPTMPYNNAVKIGLERAAEVRLKDLLIELIKKYTEGKLLTLNSANGLI